MRLVDELGPVGERILPDGGMMSLLELVICQAWSIWDGIHNGTGTGQDRAMLPVFDLVQLASCNNGRFDVDVFTDVYEPSGGVVGSDTGIGITHAAYAYKQIGRRGLLKPDSSASLPLVFLDTSPLLDEGASQVPCDCQVAAQERV